MKSVKLIAKLFAVLILGVVVLVILFNAYLTSYDPLEDLKDHILRNMDEDQKRLGVQCADGDKLISDYIDKVKSSFEDIDKGKRLMGEEPIFLQGEKVFHASTMCNGYRITLEKNGLHTLSNVVMAEDATVQEIAIVRLSLSQTIPKWCHSDCIQDAKNKVVENISLLEERMRSKGLHSKMDAH